MGRGEKKAEKKGDMLDAESSVSGANLDRAYATVPARFNVRRRLFRYVTSVSAFGFYKTAAGIFFLLKYTDYIIKTRYEIIKKILSYLVNFVF